MKTQEKVSLAILFIILVGSAVIGANQLCSCSNNETGINGISWSGLGNIANFNLFNLTGGDESHKDLLFQMCTGLCHWTESTGVS